MAEFKNARPLASCLCSNYKFVFSDFNMPQMNGCEFIDEAKNRGFHGICWIALTGGISKDEKNLLKEHNYN